MYKSSSDLEEIFPYENAEREFLRGQLLNHPHIVRSHVLFTTELENLKLSNIVLDYIDGQTLFKIKKGQISDKNSLKAALQLVDALSYALTLNFLHLDLHEGNVMLDKDSQLMVIDLASFFTYDELFAFVSEETSLEAEKEEKGVSQNSPALNSRATFKAVASVKINSLVPSKITTESSKPEKLRKFFDQNPRLFQQLKKIHEKKILEEKKKTRGFKQNLFLKKG